MLYGEIDRQRLKITKTHVVADTIDYLEAKFTFSDDWNVLEKWAHFSHRKTGAVYDIPLTDDCIRKEDHLNLSAGMWKVYLHGNEFRDGEVVQRITTDEAVLCVSPTGVLEGEPFPEMPASVTERIFARLARLEAGGGGGSGSAIPYEIGYGLSVSEDLVLSAEVGASSFTEIPNSRVQEIFNKVMEA